MLFNLLEGEANTNNGSGMWIFLIVIVALFVVMGVVNSRQRKKQMAEDQKRKDSLCVGTKVITIGGIVGKVVSVDHKKSTFVLETEGTKINFDKRAIYQMELPENAKNALIEDDFDEEPVEEPVKEVNSAPKKSYKKSTAKKVEEPKVEEVEAEEPKAE